MARVLIISAEIGEGHDLPARMLADDLRAERPGTEVVIADGLVAMGRIVDSAIKEGYRAIVDNPGRHWLFELQYWFASRWVVGRWVVAVVGYVLGGRGLLRLIAAHRPDVVVSTYPGTTEMLAWLRRRGRFDVPTCSAITDLAALRWWAARDIDLHLITHPESAAEVRSVAGPRTRIVAVRGLTSPDFLVARDRDEARRALDLPRQPKVVVISGGGWGVGDLAGAVDVALGRDDTFVVALCGRNELVIERMRARFGDHERVRVIGFTEQMPDLLTAADALVHSTAGLTVLEAIIRGCPAISYGWGAGHVRVNNEAFTRFAVAEVAATPAELRHALDRALVKRPEPDLSFGELPSAASEVLRLADGRRQTADGKD